ncbi:hypothetical protein TIFTF001_022286 [Ficus carica]|uniref:Uncharacterized protein n=1 Tax=Ficus carica TaxID=3494 RepID=A0AA88AIE1_FICCA|nr:hypothetical protein TIFTF001_022286 [Ficus carica]
MASPPPPSPLPHSSVALPSLSFFRHRHPLFPSRPHSHCCGSIHARDTSSGVTPTASPSPRSQARDPRRVNLAHVPSLSDPSNTSQATNLSAQPARISGRILSQARVQFLQLGSIILGPKSESANHRPCIQPP